MFASRRAFTLIELVVVIGLVAIVVAIVVLAITIARRTGNFVICQGNIHNLLTALHGYTLENGGYYPYGFYYVNSDPLTWADRGNGEFISWYSEISKMTGTEAFKCPVAQLVAPHPNSYVMNFIVAVTPLYELVVGDPPNAQVKPSKTDLMLPFGTALLWDTAIQPDWQNNNGYLTGVDIDLQRFWNGARTPQYRYLFPNDPLGQLPPPAPLGQNFPISLATPLFRNVDPSAGSGYPYQGNLRFRHGPNNKCNVGYSDGSVRQFTAVLRSDLTVQSHDAIRKFFMTAVPPGVVPDPSFPSFGAGNAPCLDRPFVIPAVNAYRKKLCITPNVRSP